MVVDDEPDVVALVSYNLKKEGFRVVTAANGQEALLATEAQAPDAIILDVMMPVLDGIETCRSLRADPGTSGIPIILLTARSHIDDRIRGLELGADDYVTKPFSPRELVLRIKSLLRRSSTSQPRPVVSGYAGFEIDRAANIVTLYGRQVALTGTEFRLLGLLVEKKGRITSRDQLLSEVWGYKGNVDTRTVDTHIRRLRDKLGDLADCVETVRGFGYRLRELPEK